MKKITILLIVILVSLIINIESNTEMVFNEFLEKTNIYEITFTNNLSTNNFLKYFSDVKIIWIKPKMNTLYADKLIKYNKYYFKEVSNDKNIDKFKKDYIDYIDKLGYKNEALKLQISGVMIDKMKLYLNDDQLIYINDVLTDINIENVS